MKVSKIFGIALLILFSPVLLATESGANPDKPSLHTSETMAASMQVVSVNAKTREVVLKDQQGELIHFTASDETRNLSQLAPGDIVEAEYTVKQSLEVYDKDGVIPETSEFSALGRPEAGEKPGLTAFESTTVTATVEEINLDDNTFKLRWFDDSVQQFTAMNPENLKLAEVGDVVVITETVNVDVSIAEIESD